MRLGLRLLTLDPEQWMIIDRSGSVDNPRVHGRHSAASSGCGRQYGRCAYPTSSSTTRRPGRGGNRQPTARRGRGTGDGILPRRREMAPRGRARSAAVSPPPPGRPRRRDRLLSDGWRWLAGEVFARATCQLSSRPRSAAVAPGTASGTPSIGSAAAPRRAPRTTCGRSWRLGAGCGFDPVPVGCFCLGRQVNAAGDPPVGAFSRAVQGGGRQATAGAASRRRLRQVRSQHRRRPRWEGTCQDHLIRARWWRQAVGGLVGPGRSDPRVPPRRPEPAVRRGRGPRRPGMHR